MKKRMTICMLAFAAMIFNVETSNAQLYEYKKLDGMNSKEKGEAVKKGNAQNQESNARGASTFEKGNDTGTTTMPLDGGLSLVLAAGAGLALKKKYGKKKATLQAVDQK